MALHNELINYGNTFVKSTRSSTHTTHSFACFALLLRFVAFIRSLAHSRVCGKKGFVHHMNASISYMVSTHRGLDSTSSLFHVSTHRDSRRPCHTQNGRKLGIRSLQDSDNCLVWSDPLSGSSPNILFRRTAGHST